MNTHLKRAHCLHLPALKRMDAQQMSYWRWRHFFRRLYKPFETHVIQINGRTSGFIVARRVGPAWVIYNCCVDQACQGQGFGSQLLQLVLHRAQRKGCEQVLLEVPVTHKRAMRFYQRHGFKITRTLRGVYRSPRAWVDGYEMVCDLGYLHSLM